MSERPSALKVVKPLEDNLYRKLHVEGFARSDSGRSVEVANRVTHESKPRTRVAGSTHNLRSTAGAYRPRAGSEINPVQEVKRFHAQLDFDALRNGYVLEHGEIDVCVARAMQRVPSETRRARSGKGECRRIPPLLTPRRCRERVRA